jgi:hypothetical protein
MLENIAKLYGKKSSKWVSNKMALSVSVILSWLFCTMALSTHNKLMVFPIAISFSVAMLNLRNLLAKNDFDRNAVLMLSAIIMLELSFVVIYA